MGIFKRALTCLSKNYKKSLLLFSIIAVLGSLLSGALYVREAAIQGGIHLRRRTPAVFTLGLDPEWTHEQLLQTGIPFHETWEWEWELLAPINQLPHVESVFFTNQLIGNFFDLNHYFPVTFDFEPTGFVEGQPRNFIMRGISQEIPAMVEQGIMELVEGRVFTESELADRNKEVPAPVLMSRSLAQRNGLTVGSVIANYSHASLETTIESELVADLTFDLEVIGLLDFEYDMMEAFINEQDVFNQTRDTRMALELLYVPIWFNEVLAETVQETLALAFGSSEAIPEHLLWFVDVADNPIFTLSDPLYLDDFLEVVEPLLPEGIIVQDLSALHGPALAAMEHFQWLSHLVLFGSGSAIIIILSLLITLFLSDRRQEIGIYLAIGEKKSKVMFQFLLETLSMTVLALSAALFIGHLFSSALSRTMLEHELYQMAQEAIPVQVQENLSAIQWISGLPPQNIPTEELLDMFNLNLDAQVSAMFFVIGIGTVLLATVIPTLYVVRLNPKKILL